MSELIISVFYCEWYFRLLRHFWFLAKEVRGFRCMDTVSSRQAKGPTVMNLRHLLHKVYVDCVKYLQPAASGLRAYDRMEL